MNLNVPSVAPVDYFFSLLKPLSHNDKLELITKLSQSLKNEPPVPQSVPLSALFGAYKSDETAEELIENLRSARVSNRFIEPL